MFAGISKVACKTIWCLQAFVIQDMQQERAYFLIDGNNFYHKLQDLNLQWYSGRTFNFSLFAQTLLDDQALVKTTYYVGKVRTDGTDKAQKMHADQQRLLAHLKKHQFSYSLGYLLKDGKTGSFHEKGVDVHIAVDMLVGAYENLCDTVYLVSSDSDLEQAVRKIQEKGRRVVHVGFQHKPCKVLIAECREKRMLDRGYLLPFVQYETPDKESSPQLSL